ncbi:MAG: hypothetical protein PHS07_01945 [Patescibacteria group bacterium]|nr:hypothetical protein [Patescibacteria group bacterium]
MKFFKKYLGLFLGLIIFVSLELLFKKQFLVWWILCLNVFAVVIIYQQLIKTLEFKKKIILILSPVIFYVSSFLFLILIVPQAATIYKHTLVVLISIILGMNCSIWQRWFLWSRINQSYLQGNFQFLNLVSVFLSTAVFLNITFLLQVPFWFNQFLLAFIIIILTYQLLIIQCDFSVKAYLFLPILGLIFIELFWIVSLLPINFYSGAMLMALFFYLFSGLSLDFLSDQLKKNNFKKYIIISLVILILVLTSAKWF